jgi:alpha-beta hydrolase superfamily lysophospholipase
MSCPKAPTRHGSCIVRAILHGVPTTASATVVTPAGEPPAGGWSLPLWAHGTTGVARQCAASTTKSLGYYVPELVQQGFAVVAVDYAGMGNDNGGTEYLTKTSNALDTINAVPSAQQAVRQPTRTWVAIGHSRGGLAVWGAAELEAKQKDPELSRRRGARTGGGRRRPYSELR